MARAWAFLLIATLLADGCILNPDEKAKNAEDTSDNTTYLVSEYYPLKVGVVRHYGIFSREASQEYYGELTESIIGTDIIDNKQYYKQQFAWSWDEEKTNYKYTYLRYNNNSVVIGADSDYVPKQSDGYWPGEINYFTDEETLEISMQHTLGKEYVYTDTDASGITDTQSEVYSSESIIINNINFDNCLKCVILSQKTGRDGGLIETYDWTEWYAKGIGMVKYQKMFTDKDGVMTTTTLTLTEYRVP